MLSEHRPSSQNKSPIRSGSGSLKITTAKPWADSLSFQSHRWCKNYVNSLTFFYPRFAKNYDAPSILRMVFCRKPLPLEQFHLYDAPQYDQYHRCEYRIVHLNSGCSSPNIQCANRENYAPTKGWTRPFVVSGLVFQISTKQNQLNFSCQPI